MTWRLANWILWSVMVIMLLLGALKIVAQQYVWLAASLATLAEIFFVIQKQSPPSVHRPPLPLDDEMVRTQDRGYQRAIRRFSGGGSIEYDGQQFQVVGDSLQVRRIPDPDLLQAAAETQEGQLRTELAKARQVLMRLQRLSPEIDTVARDHRISLILDASIPSADSAVCNETDGVFAWGPPATGDVQTTNSREFE